MAILRGRGVGLTLGLQSVPQLEAMYGRRRRKDQATNGMGELKRLCEEYIEWLKGADYNPDEDSDREHYIYAKAPEVALGKNIFGEINRILGERNKRL